jgi:hypothetical protein
MYIRVLQGLVHVLVEYRNKDEEDGEKEKRYRRTAEFLPERRKKKDF